MSRPPTSSAGVRTVSRNAGISVASLVAATTLACVQLPWWEPAPETAFTALLEEFTELHGIGAAAFGVMWKGDVIHEGATGFMDAERRIPVAPDVMMRIASLTKPVTAAAVRRLADDGLLALTDPVFDLGQPGDGLLALDPFPALRDPRLREITVLHALRHRGGWDRGIAGDWVFRDIEIAKAMSLPSPPGRENTVRHILGQPLQFDPGSRRAYSNIGYLVLGLIVEQVSGQDYMTYVRERIFAPLGVPAGDVIRGRTFPKDRSEREPWYDAEGQGLVRNVFDPSGSPVRRPDGGWDMEARMGDAGLVASTRAILEFLDVYVVSGDDIGRRRRRGESVGRWRYHAGSLAGTNSLAYQRGNGLNYVVLFNRRASSPDRSYFVNRFREVFDSR